MTLSISGSRLARLWSAIERAADLAELQLESADLSPIESHNEQEGVHTVDDLIENQDCSDSREVR